MQNEIQYKVHLSALFLKRKAISTVHLFWDWVYTTAVGSGEPELHVEPNTDAQLSGEAGEANFCFHAKSFYG